MKRTRKFVREPAPFAAQPEPFPMLGGFTLSEHAPRVVLSDISNRPGRD